MTKSKAPGVRATYGEKMIEVKVRFWTDDMAGKGEIVPKNAWTAGVVRIDRNDVHGIKPGKPRHFNTTMEIPAMIERVLIEHGISLHPSPKMRKYLTR